MSDYSYIYYAKQIMKFLILNKEKAYSMGEIHNELLKKNLDLKTIETDKLTKFKQAFFTLEKDYENIYRFVRNNKQYLIWTLKDREDIKELDNKLITDNISNNIIDTLNYVDIIEEFLKENKYEYITDNNYLDGSNNAIHILIKNNKKAILEDLNKYHKIDWNNKNILGKTCLDIAKESKQVDMIEFILMNIYDNIIKDLKGVIEKQKNIQKDILDKRTELRDEYEKELASKRDLEEYITNLYIVLFIVSVPLFLVILHVIGFF